MTTVNIITSGIKKALLEIPKNELRKSKEKQTDEVLPFTLHLIQIIYPYIAQTGILLKSLRDMFQDLKASNLKTVSDNHLTLRNY